MNQNISKNKRQCRLGEFHCGLSAFCAVTLSCGASRATATGTASPWLMTDHESVWFWHSFPVRALHKFVSLRGNPAVWTSRHAGVPLTHCSHHGGTSALASDVEWPASSEVAPAGRMLVNGISLSDQCRKKIKQGRDNGRRGHGHDPSENYVAGHIPAHC